MATTLHSLLNEARSIVSSCTIDEAKSKLSDPSYVFVDVREPEERETDGQIPGAIHVPRGMLEFRLDAASPYYDPIFNGEKSIIFFCKSGSRSLLASHKAIDMGLSNVINMEGGILAWNQK